MILSILQTLLDEIAKRKAQPNASPIHFSPNTKPGTAERGSSPAQKTAATPTFHEVGDFSNVRRGFRWLQFGRSKKRLQMLETVSLGEKRFVALVQVDGRQFLIGGAPSNVGMLAELAPEETFHQVLREATQGLAMAAEGSNSLAGQKHAHTQPEAPVQTTLSHPDTAVRAEAVQDAKPVVSMAPAIEPADEPPFSLSPTVLARMGAQPAPSAPPEHLELQPVFDAEAAARPPVTTAEEDSSAYGPLPAFTFQVSPILPSIVGASRQQTPCKFGIDAARRMASAWKLKEATS